MTRWDSSHCAQGQYFSHDSCLDKLYRLFLSPSTFLSCWKFALTQPELKKGDDSQPSKLLIHCFDFISLQNSLMCSKKRKKSFFYCNYFQIISMHSFWAVPLTILPASLIYGHPYSGNLVKPLLLNLTYQEHLTESGIQWIQFSLFHTHFTTLLTDLQNKNSPNHGIMH